MQNPFNRIRQFHEIVSPLPSTFCIPSDREWYMRKTRFEDEQNEFLVASYGGRPDTAAKALEQIKEAADTILSGCGFILAHGLDPEEVLTVVIENCMERAMLGMADGEFTHCREDKMRLEADVMAKLVALAWGGWAVSLPKYCPCCGELYECVEIGGICQCLVCSAKFEFIPYEDDAP